MKAATLAALLIGAAPALASDEASWESFRAEVRKGCEKAVAGTFEKPAITVDPHGSESYGIAIARGKSKYGDATLTMVCVFDKKTKRIETSGEFGQ